VACVKRSVSRICRDEFVCVNRIRNPVHPHWSARPGKPSTLWRLVSVVIAGRYTRRRHSAATEAISKRVRRSGNATNGFDGCVRRSSKCEVRNLRMRTQFLIGPRPRADEPRNTLNTRKGIVEEEKIERDKGDRNPDENRPGAHCHLDVISNRSKPTAQCGSNVYKASQ